MPVDFTEALKAGVDLQPADSGEFECEHFPRTDGRWERFNAGRERETFAAAACPECFQKLRRAGLIDFQGVWERLELERIEKLTRARIAMPKIWSAKAAKISAAALCDAAGIDAAELSWNKFKRRTCSKCKHGCRRVSGASTCLSCGGKLE